MNLAHRLIWLWHYGDVPDGWQIDHLDGDPGNNHIGNLRAVPPAGNLRNKARPRSNTSGHSCVSWIAERQKWRARTFLGAKSKHLGYFAEKEAAERAVRNEWQAQGCTERHGV